MPKQPHQSLLSNEQTREIRTLVGRIVTTALRERGEIYKAENLAAYNHAVNAAEAGVVEALLAHLGGNQSATAIVGGLSRSTVRNIINRNNINPFLMPHQQPKPLPTQQQQSNTDTRSMAQKFSILYAERSGSSQWEVVTAALEQTEQGSIGASYRAQMIDCGIEVEKSYADGGGKAVMFTDGSIYRHIFWGM